MSLSAGNASNSLTKYALTVHTGESKIIEKDGWLLLPTDEENYIVGYNGSSYVLTLPSEIDGVTYTAISHSALRRAKAGQHHPAEHA